MLVLSALLGVEGVLYRVLFGAQLGYYALTLLATSLGRLGIRIPGLSALVFFNTTNLAYFVALLRVLAGARVHHWTPAR